MLKCDSAFVFNRFVQSSTVSPPRSYWTFRSASDEYSTRLLKLYRAKTGAIGQEMEKLLDKLDQ